MRPRRLTALAMLGALAGPAAAADPQPVRVYVPRSIRVSAETLRMDDICVVRSQDEQAVVKACSLAMGRAPWSREAIVVKRQTILSRLATAGIAASRVRFTGAQHVVVSRNEKVIGAAELVKAAEGFLKKNHPLPAAQGYRLERKAEDVVLLTDRGDTQLRARLAEEGAQNRVNVEVSVLADGRQLAVRTVRFRIGYQHRQVVATKAIPAGGVVTPENAKVRIVQDDSPVAQQWASPFGKVLATPVSAGAVIPLSLLRKTKAPIAVRRNQRVVMRVAGAGFTISALGQALEDGRPGDLIKVQNVDTKRVLTAKVNADGTVAPVYEERS
ncbi:MAG TPA: flagellar basal body P-ring formation chaperone FlgA [Phycisphaerae bacterium]|nr:flagellar basal body P-ring formation chaperone FlgA [Phycisphaerae bacterium]HUT59983.1 flagellar basal body P-ring formation chaperone FlgA [Phycisphaerae bacterium]